MSTFNIVAVNTGYGGSFYVSGNQTAKFQETVWFNVNGSTGNNGSYIVLGSSVVGPNTRIDIINAQNIPSPIIDGQIFVTPYKAYKINFRDPAKTPFYIAPQTSDNTNTAITLPGSGKFDYGEMMDENLLHIMENFARTISPGNPIQGQLWYDTSVGILKIWDGVWAQVNAAALAGAYVDVIGDTMTGALVVSQSVVTNNFEQHYTLLGNVGAGAFSDSNLVINGNTTYPYSGGYPPENTILPSINFKANNLLRFIISHETMYAQNDTDPNYLVIDRSVDNESGDLLIGSWSINSSIATDQVGMKVGIGTYSPSYKLHVSSPSNVVAGFNGTNNNNSTAIRIHNDLGARSWDIGVASTAHPTIPNKWFFINDVTGGTNPLVIDTAGRVGLGISTPQRKLHLHDATSAIVSLQITNSSEPSPGAGDGLLLYNNLSNATLSNEEAGYLRFQTSALERMRIDSLGNIGIGTTTPTHKLHISSLSDYALFEYFGSGSPNFSNRMARGTSSIPTSVILSDRINHDFQFYDGSAYQLTSRITSEVTSAPAVGNVPTSLIFSVGSSTGTLSEALRINQNKQLVLSKTGGGDIIHSVTNDSIHISGSTSTTFGANLILFGQTHATQSNQTVFRVGATESMKIDASGNVAIGVVTASSKLDVGGSIRFAAGASNLLISPDGSVGTPSITFGNDLSVGLHRPSADTLGISTSNTNAGSYTFSGSNLDMQGVGSTKKKIVNLADPTSNYDAVNLQTLNNFISTSVLYSETPINFTGSTLQITLTAGIWVVRIDARVHLHTWNTAVDLYFNGSQIDTTHVYGDLAGTSMQTLSGTVTIPSSGIYTASIVGLVPTVEQAALDTNYYRRISIMAWKIG